MVNSDVPGGVRRTHGSAAVPEPVMVLLLLPWCGRRLRLDAAGTPIPRLAGVLLVVRHGETEPNVSGLFLGRADPPLTELGRRQARALAAALPTS